MRSLFLVFLLALQIPQFSLHAEDAEVDSAVGAGQAESLADLGAATAAASAMDAAVVADKLALAAQTLRTQAKQLRAEGKSAEAAELEKKADALQKKSDAAALEALKQVKQAGALSQTSGEETYARAQRISSTEDDPPQVSTQPKRYSKPLTGPEGGEVRMDDPRADAIRFVCEGGRCRLKDGNVAMENAFNRHYAQDPDNTHAITSLDEMREVMQQAPKGVPVVITGHGGSDGLTLDEGVIVAPNSAELKQMGEMFKGHPVLFESCSLATAPGFGSRLSELTGAPVAAYDKTMYSQSDGFYAKDPDTSIHVWRPDGSTPAPGEMPQRTVELYDTSGYFFPRSAPAQQYLSHDEQFFQDFTAVTPFLLSSAGNSYAERVRREIDSIPPNRETGLPKASSTEPVSSSDSHKRTADKSKEGNDTPFEFRPLQVVNSSKLIADAIIKSIKDQSEQIIKRIQALVLQGSPNNKNVDAGASLTVTKTVESSSSNRRPSVSLVEK